MAKQLEFEEREDPRSIQVRCVPVHQPIGTFYVASIAYRDLCDISFFDVRRRLQEERDFERYLGIQRPLNDRRVAQLVQYVTFFDATFPTSIIIAVDARCATVDEAKGEMTLSNYLGSEDEEPILFRNIARVLDGQHRIAGLFEYKGEAFDLSVSIFVDIDIADQAYIFSTVNLEQTKVNKSLAYDLFELAKARSPQKTCHNVAIALDQDPTSPFYQRIKRLGVATEGRFSETITQANFVESLLRYITADARADRDVLLRGKSLPPASADQLSRHPLRNMFIASRDLDIAKLLFNYFSAVRDRWPQAWAQLGRGAVLNRTNGFRGLMRVFRPMYLFLTRPGELVSRDGFLEIFAKSKLADQDFNVDRFPPGTTGEARIFHALVEELNL